MSDDTILPAASDAPSRVRSRTATTAIWLSSAALLLCAALVIPYLAPRNVVFGILLGIAAVAAVTGLVLGIRARRPRAALVSAIVALAVDVALLAVFLFGLAALSAPHDQVELRGQGPGTLHATFSSEGESDTMTWPSDGGYKSFPTTGSWAELTVEAAREDASAQVECQILWNGEIVVEETGTGTVTCRYDAR
ncbi:hypothetical protein [Microbacterium resistens]